MSSFSTSFNTFFLHQLRRYLEPDASLPKLKKHPPHGETARSLLDELHRQEFGITFMSSPEINLATSHATIGIYQERVLPLLLAAINEDIQQHQERPSTNPTASLETVLKHRDIVGKQTQADIWRKAIGNVSDSLLDEIRPHSPRCPFAFLQNSASKGAPSKRQLEAIKNLWGGLGTAIRFLDTLTSEIARLLPETKKDAENFFKVAYRLSPLLKQFAMLHIRFIDGNKKIQDILKNDPRLELKDDCLVYNTEGLTNPEELVPTHGLIKDPRIKQYIQELAKAASKMAQYLPLWGQVQYPFQMGCPALDIHIPTKDVPKVLLPEGFKKNKIGLIDLLLFHYLYLLKREAAFTANSRTRA